jgi:putative addiction module component (TIGR02574 family)
LAGSLLESLDGAPDDPEAVEAAWNEEIARRIEELDSGKVKPVSLETFRRKLSSAAE